MGYNVYNDYDDMMDLKYGEENCGRRREVAFIPTEEDMESDPEFNLHMAEEYAAKNQSIREMNLRDENNRLRSLLEEHGIDIPEVG